MRHKLQGLPRVPSRLAPLARGQPCLNLAWYYARYLQAHDMNCSSRHRVVSCFHNIQPLALGLSGVVSVDHDVPEFVREGVVGLRLGGVEGVYNRSWHSTSQSPPVHWGVHREPLFYAFYAIYAFCDLQLTGN